ncbi:hypothetical protein HYR99_26755 [Candidatus Poribacteria bacterium]|nr:hypothetical protein [Candidatus Poribacteria bacterium]
MAITKMPWFHIRDMDKAIEALKEWGYELKQPSYMDDLEFQVVGANLFIRGYPSRQADVQLEPDYSRSDYDLFRRLKRKFWDDHIYFKKRFGTLK